MSKQLDEARKFAAEIKTPEEVKRLKSAVLKVSKRVRSEGELSLLDLSRSLDAKVSDVEAAIAALYDEGYEVRTTDGILKRHYEPPRGSLTSHIARLQDGGWIRLGVLGDNQGGNRHQRLDVLATAYDHYKAEGIDTVFHTGNMLDGYHPKLNGFEVLPEAGTSIESQIAYMGKLYPKVPGITTRFITGECHEGWWAKREGINVGRVMEDRFRLPAECTAPGSVCKVVDGTCKTHGRDDLRYIGHLEADIELRVPELAKKKAGPIARIIHPGGGSSYAYSYTTQKMAESLQGGEKPQVQFVGHFHKFDYNYSREIHNVQTGCLCDQTIFMRKNKIAAHVGYLICEMKIGTDGIINRFRAEWTPFYDQGFYKRYETW